MPAEVAALIADAYYLLRTDRAEQAAMIAGPLLAEDPEDPARHRLFVTVHVALLERGLLLQSYRAWLAEAPEEPLRRLSLAFVVATDRPVGTGTEDWCPELARLSLPMPAAPNLRYWNLRVRREAILAGCPGDANVELAEILKLVPEWAEAVPYAALLRMQREPVDAELASSLEQTWRQQPWRLESAGPLWASTARGDGLEQARKDALDAAEKAALSPRRAEVDAARIVATAAGEQGLADRLAQHLLLLDPTGPEPRLGPFREKLESVEQVPQGNRQLLLLESLRTTVPPTGVHAARWYAMRGNSLASLGRLEEAWRSYSRAFELAPKVYGTLWLQVAAREGYQPRKALRYLNQLLERPPDLPLVLGGDHRDLGLSSRAALYRLQGELYERLGLLQEAADSWRLSLLMQEDGATHLKLGMVLARTPGAEEEALASLLRGLALAPSGAWTREKSTALELWKRGRWWDPRGMPALVEALSRLQDQSLPPAPMEEVPSFPNLSFRVAGEERRISDYSGPMMVDVWASWCSPCVVGLPKLEALARAFPRVTVLALSVDEKEATLLNFFSTRPAPSFTLGWAGVGAMQSLGISTIPTTYLLDAQHRVVARFQGDEEARDIEEILRRL